MVNRYRFKIYLSLLIFNISLSHFATAVPTGSGLSSETPSTGSDFSSEAPSTGSDFSSEAPSTGSDFGSETPPPLCINNNIDLQLRCLINRHSLTGDPSAGRHLPDITESPLAQLGRKLFFSTDLGGNNDAACVTCHHPLLGGADALHLSIGAEIETPSLLGPGRTLLSNSTFVLRNSEGKIIDLGPTEPRNAPTTFNVGFLDSGLFWDSRIESNGKTPLVNGADGSGISTPDGLAAPSGNVNGSNLPALQAQFPVTSSVEMKGAAFENIDMFGGLNTTARNAARSALVVRMKSTSSPTSETTRTTTWPELFEGAGLSADFTFTDIGNAIGEFERSQVLIDSPWKNYVKDEELLELSHNAKWGAILFLTPFDENVSANQKGFGCVSCHSGDNFTDEKFHAIAIPQIGRGGGRDKRPDEPISASTGDKNDTGRYFVSGLEADKFAFRTPPLLNVELTAPYGHSGAYSTLEGIVEHYSDPKKAIDTYDFSQLLDIPEVQTERMKENTIIQLQSLSGLLKPVDDPLNMTALEIQQVTAFLKSLTSDCAKTVACLSRWIPEDSETFPSKLVAHDQHGDKSFSRHLSQFNKSDSNASTIAAVVTVSSVTAMVVVAVVVVTAVFIARHKKNHYDIK